MSAQDLLQEEGGILITGHSRRNPIGIGDPGGKGYLETIVVETGWIGIRHLGEFQIVGGDDSRDREF